MRRSAVVLTFSFALAGCEPTTSNLMAPMEPTRESVAAPRRDLTQAEKDAVAEAVTAKLGPSSHPEFKWMKLIVRTHDRVVDYCGLVTPNDTSGDDNDYSDANASKRQKKFYAWLSFDGREQLKNVDVRSIAKYRENDPPTEVNSICIQDGYGAWR